VELSRHLDVVFHYVKDKIEKKKLIKFSLTKEMHADFLTKSTINPQYTKLQNRLIYGNGPNMRGGDRYYVHLYEHFFNLYQLNRI
jgi:hypothetical protein